MKWIDWKVLVSLILVWVGAHDVHGADENESRKLFLKLCAPCHGPDGRARTRAARKLRVKDLTKSRTTDAQIRQQIIDGWFDQRGKRRMPAYGGQLSADQVSALVGEVRRLRK